MKTLEEYLVLAEQAHGHMCAGQVLGVRLALYGLKLLGLADPEGKDRQRLITFIEIDRCATDAVGVVTGCRLGRRSLKFRDFGKVAATFCDLETGRAVRMVATETSRERAREIHPEFADPKQQQMLAYRELPDEELFTTQWVRVRLSPEDLPGYKARPSFCAQCGEAVKFRREVVRGGSVLCRACAGESYYEPL